MNSEMSRYKRKRSDEVLNNSGRGCILNLLLVATEDGYLERILRRVRSPNLIWLRWYKCPYSCLPSWIPMENLKVLEVAGEKLKILWKRQSQVCLLFFSGFISFVDENHHIRLSDSSNVNLAGPSRVTRAKYHLAGPFRLSEVHRAAEAPREDCHTSSKFLKNLT